MTIPFPLRPILLLVTVYYLNFLSRIILAPLLPVIEDEIGLGHGAAGSLFLFITAGYATGLLGSTFVSSRLNHRHTVLVSTVTVGGAMLAASRSATMPVMDVGLFVIGVGAGLFLPSGIAMITELVRKEHWGKAMVVHELAPTTALMTAPFFAEAMLRLLPWRDILGIVGVVSILWGGLFVVFGRGGHQKGESPNPKAMQTVLRDSSFWIMTIVVTLGIATSLGLYMMLPLFLVNEIGFDRQLANTIIGFSRMFGVVILFFSGMITDRIGHKHGTISFYAIMGTLTLLIGIIQGRVATPILIILQGTSVPCFFAAAFAMISSIFPSYLRSLAVSFLVTLGFLLGAGAVPPGIGYLAEALSFSLGFSLVGISVLATLPLLYYVRADSKGDEQR